MSSVPQLWRYVSKNLYQRTVDGCAELTRKSTRDNTNLQLAFNLLFVWPRSCADLWRLARTCIDFGRAQIRTQVNTSFSPFGHPTQVGTSWSQVICCYRNALTNEMRKIHAAFWPLFENPYAIFPCAIFFCRFKSSCSFMAGVRTRNAL